MWKSLIEREMRGRPCKKFLGVREIELGEAWAVGRKGWGSVTLIWCEEEFSMERTLS